MINNSCTFLSHLHICMMRARVGPKHRKRPNNLVQRQVWNRIGKIPCLVRSPVLMGGDFGGRQGRVEIPDFKKYSIGDGFVIPILEAGPTSDVFVLINKYII